MNNITPFNYGDNLIRVVNDETTGEPLWVAKDVCDVLEYKEVSKTLAKLDDDEKLTRKFFVSGQNREMMCVTESGLYTLILRSNKPEAKPFKRWVTHEVLPTIRKTGSYSSTALLDLSPITSIMESQTRILETMAVQNTVMMQMMQNSQIYSTLIVVMLKDIDERMTMSTIKLESMLQNKHSLSFDPRPRISSEQRAYLYELIGNKAQELSELLSIKKEVMMIGIFSMLKREFSCNHYSDIRSHRFEATLERVNSYDPTL